jgi:P27 family predicted phage terminase small subunit
MANSVTHKKIKVYLGVQYQPSDDELINLYCETHALYRQMQAEIKKDGLMVHHTNKHGETNLIKHPLSIEVSKQGTLLRSLLKSLGLTAAQRKEIVEPGNSFDDF